MQTFSIDKNTVFYKDNIQQRLLKRIGQNWQAEEVHTGKVSNITEHELLTGFMNKSVTFPHADDIDPKKHKINPSTIFSELDLDTQIELKNRKIFLDSHIRVNQFEFTLANLQESIDRFWRIEFGQKPCSKSALDWARNYVSNGMDILALKSADHLKGNRTSRVSPFVTDIYKKAIVEHYLTRDRFPAKTAYKFAVASIATINKDLDKTLHYEIPSLKYFKKLINQHSAYEICLKREGQQRARVKFRNAVHTLDPQYPLHIVLIDHTELDITLCGDNGMPLGRPWLTLATDLYTRAILGFHITFDHPSQHSVASTLLHAILPKTDLDTEFPEINGKYPMRGIPTMIFVDNGIEFHSAHLTELCLRLGIVLWYTPRKTPWFKANIEVTIGIVNRLITDAGTGKNFNSIENRGDNNPIKEAKIPLSYFKRSAVKLIVDVYHETIHTTTAIPPRALWEKATELTPPQIPLDIQNLNLLVLEKAERRAWHYGIDVNDMRYNNAALGDLRKIYGETLDVKVRWNKYDLGHIYVETPDGSYLKVEANDAYQRYATGLSLYQHQVHKDYLKTHQYPVSLENLAIAAVECYKLMRAREYSAKKNNMDKWKFEEGHPLSFLDESEITPAKKPKSASSNKPVHEEFDEVAITEFGDDIDSY
jgi:putative transposase